MVLKSQLSPELWGHYIPDWVSSSQKMGGPRLGGSLLYRGGEMLVVVV